MDVEFGEQIAAVDVSALYLIAAPKTPEPVRAEVICPVPKSRQPSVIEGQDGRIKNSVPSPTGRTRVTLDKAALRPFSRAV